MRFRQVMRFGSVHVVLRFSRFGSCGSGGHAGVGFIAVLYLFMRFSSRFMQFKHVKRFSSVQFVFPCGSCGSVRGGSRFMRFGQVLRFGSARFALHCGSCGSVHAVRFRCGGSVRFWKLAVQFLRFCSVLRPHTDVKVNDVKVRVCSKKMIDVNAPWMLDILPGLTTQRGFIARSV